MVVALRKFELADKENDQESGNCTRPILSTSEIQGTTEI